MDLLIELQELRETVDKLEIIAPSRPHSANEVLLEVHKAKSLVARLTQATPSDIGPYDEWSVFFTNCHLQFFLVRDDYHPRMIAELDETARYTVEIDRDPVSAGLDLLMGKVAVIREYTNRVGKICGDAMIRRSVVQRQFGVTERMFKILQSDASRTIQAQNIEGTSSKERESMAIQYTRYPIVVLGLWEDFLEECKTHEAVLKEQKRNLTDTRQDLLTQVAGLKVFKDTNGGLGHSLRDVGAPEEEGIARLPNQAYSAAPLPLPPVTPAIRMGQPQG